MKWIIVLYVLLVLHVQMESVAKTVLMISVNLELVGTQIVLTLVHVLVGTGALRKAKNPSRAKLVHSLTMVPLMNAQHV